MKTYGITLIELLVVMSIMSIIALAAFPTYQTHLRESRRQDAIIGIRNMQLAVDSYIVKNNKLPENNAAEVTNPKDILSENKLYDIAYSKLPNNEDYKITATAKAATTQATDKAKTANNTMIDCNIIYITNKLDTTYPYECK